MDNQLLTADEMRAIFENYSKELLSEEEIAKDLFSDETVLRTAKGIIDTAINVAKLGKREIVICIESSDPRFYAAQGRKAIFSDDPRYADFTNKVAQKLRDLGYTCKVYCGEAHWRQFHNWKNEITVTW